MVLFSFRSRTQSMKMYDLLRTNGIECEVINTPRQISSSCGLSVSLDERDLERSVGVYDYFHPDTLIGVFISEGNGYRRY